MGTLVSCHGFMAQPLDYSRLLSQVATHRIDVIAPFGHARGFDALAGRRTVREEVADLVAMIDEIGPATLSGHSRGGQVAWIVGASAGSARNVVVIDPVDGEGRRPASPRATIGSGPRDPPSWSEPPSADGAPRWVSITVPSLQAPTDRAVRCSPASRASTSSSTWATPTSSIPYRGLLAESLWRSAASERSSANRGRNPCCYGIGRIASETTTLWHRVITRRLFHVSP